MAENETNQEGQTSGGGPQKYRGPWGILLGVCGVHPLDCLG